MGYGVAMTASSLLLVGTANHWIRVVGEGSKESRFVGWTWPFESRYGSSWFEVNRYRFLLCVVMYCFVQDRHVMLVQRCSTNVPGVDIQFDIAWSFPIHRRKNTSWKFQDVDEKMIDCSLWSMRVAAPYESTRLCVDLNGWMKAISLCGNGMTFTLTSPKERGEGRGISKLIRSKFSDWSLKLNCPCGLRLSLRSWVFRDFEHQPKTL